MPRNKSISINRRAVAKGVAWATPIVVASTAVPAVAASRCDPKSAPGFRQAGSWAIKNPDRGKLKSAGSNRPSTFHGKEYWISNTTALGEEPATIRITAGFESGADDSSILNTECGMYRVRIYMTAIETRAASGEYRGNPKVTITLRDPRGKLINGKTLRYTTDPAGQPGGFIPVTLGEDIQAQEWTLKAIPGVYRFEAVFDVPAEGLESRRVQNRGLGFTVPIFEPM